MSMFVMPFWESNPWLSVYASTFLNPSEYAVITLALFRAGEEGPGALRTASSADVRCGDWSLGLR